MESCFGFCFQKTHFLACLIPFFWLVKYQVSRNEFYTVEYGEGLLLDKHSKRRETCPLISWVIILFIRMHIYCLVTTGQLANVWDSDVYRYRVRGVNAGESIWKPFHWVKLPKFLLDKGRTAHESLGLSVMRSIYIFSIPKTESDLHCQDQQKKCSKFFFLDHPLQGFCQKL